VKSIAAKYHWTAHESIAEGLQRIAGEQLQLAISELVNGKASLDKAVHEARKSVKKIRSALRLVRAVLGKEYDKANDVLRDAGRQLSPLRDSQALIEIFDELTAKYREELGDHSLASVRDGLLARRKELHRSFQRQQVSGKVVNSLRELAAGIEKWNLDKADFGALSKAFGTTIRQNRKACHSAYADAQPEGFHEWRKRVKDLRYHLALLRHAWPPVLDAYAEAAKDLEHRLGDDHNLVVLRDTILKSPDDFGKEEDITALLQIVDHHQKQLRAEAKSLAIPLYSDKPNHWRRRLELWWSA
jgi:CHAD domain-containing protein